MEHHLPTESHPWSRSPIIVTPFAAAAYTGGITIFSDPVLKVLGRRFNYRANSVLVNADVGLSWLLISD